MKAYNHKKIEQKWQKYWEEKEIYKTKNFSTSLRRSKPKYYVLDMFPYPSGEGLHVGHPKGYIATDILARMKIMQGHNVLHPMGWDAFGLPAENYAIKNKIHPRKAVEKNIKKFKSQLEKIGFTYDWSREINTTDPEFYKITQWMFLQMFKKGLAYESNEPVNWCPGCKTVLANEDLENGKCERCGAKIEKKPLRQWVLKITDYADRLLKGLDDLDWEDSIKEMQRNWIGRSEGAEVEFRIKNYESRIKIFTTRPDTLFGCTYMVLSPEHSLIQNSKFKIQNYNEVAKYIDKAKNKSDLERTDLAKEKTGVELKGIKAINPVNNEEIPIWIADYVLASYGTGAIMAVPAHDYRDLEFAKKYNLPIREVVQKISSKQQILEKDIIGVGILIKTNDEKILLQERDNNTNINPGKIAPFGGGIEKGESYLDTVVRELKEELDLKVNKKDIKEIGAFRSHAYKGKSIMMFQIYDIDKSGLKLNEGQGIAKLSLAEVAKHNLVTDFTKEVLKTVVANKLKVFMSGGVNINSDFLDGLKTAEAKKKMTKWLEENKLGKKAVNYKLRDWVFSRQRYWGEPIPIIHCKKCGAVAVPEKDLPVKLPEVKNYEPTGTGESPLANIKDWVIVKCPKCGGPAKRETNTMPQWAGSSWYYLAYIMQGNSKFKISAQGGPASGWQNSKLFNYWMPVDFYVGGAEHATRHLIYARFWHKFLYDIGVVGNDEPFKKLKHVGLILAEDGRKMSKRWGNVINPDDIVEKYGADSLRIYEMFMGPFGQPVEWNTNGLIGARRFLEKIFALQRKTQTNADKTQTNAELIRLLHQTIKKVTEDIESFDFNTAISQLMILVNAMEKEKKISLIHYFQFLILLSPFAPHITEELWSNLGHKDSIFKEKWPKYDPKFIKEKEIELVIQINGKVRDKIKTPADILEDSAKKIALESEKIEKWIEGKKIKKIIFVKGKLVNVVI